MSLEVMSRNVREGERVCLKCNKKFLSCGPGNRICRPCTSANNQLSISEAALQNQRGRKRHNGEVIDPLDNSMLA